MGYSRPFGTGEGSLQREARMHRMLGVTIRSPRFGTATAIARNVSPGGMGGSTGQWLGADEEIEVQLPNIGWVAARVAWTEGSRFGLRFVQAIDAARVTREIAPGIDRGFEILERFRPDLSQRRPGLGSR